MKLVVGKSTGQLERVFLSIPDVCDDDLPSRFGDEDALLSVIHPSPEAEAASGERNAPSVDTTTSESMTSELCLRQSPEVVSSNDIIHSPQTRPQHLQLDLLSLGLIGRDEEVAALKTCLDHLMDENGASPGEDGSTTKRYEKQLLFIGGNSGSGKTTLSRTLENHVTERYRGVFVEGKCEMQASDTPFFGIAKALGKLCLEVSRLGNTTELADALVLELPGDELEPLMDIIPELKQLIPDYTTAVFDADADADPLDAENGLSRSKHAFRKIARLLSAQTAPIVIVVDDMQWADVTSLQVVDYLISDSGNPNPLMIIGCYRLEDVDENSLLYNKIASFKAKSTEFSFGVTEISLKGFHEDDVFKLLTPSMPFNSDEELQKLSEVCVKRTMGNPYFVIQFLKVLEAKGFMKYAPESQQWSWDIVAIEKETMSTANVVALLRERMRRMPKKVQRLLHFSACLGSSFDIDVISRVWTKYNPKDQNRITELVTFIEKNDFIEKRGPKKYQFVHDKVQEAALSFAGAAGASFQFDVGIFLYYSLEKHQRNEALFSIVDLINKGDVQNDRSDFADINLLSAEKARGISAYHSASHYAAHGIESLPSDRWISKPALSLQLYTMAVEMAFVLGDIDTVKSRSKEVLLGADFTPLEVLPNDYATSSRFLKIALSMQKIAGGSKAAKCAYCAHAYGLTWVEKLEKSVSPTIESYKLGLMNGDPEFAICKIFLPYQMGHPIASILKECPKVLSQCEDYAQLGHASVVRVYYQFLLLISDASNPPLTVLEGDIYRHTRDDDKSSVHQATSHLAKGEMDLLSCTYEAVAGRSIAKGDFFEKAALSFFMIMIETFHRALCLYFVARKTKKRKYRSYANKLRRRIEKWGRSGNPNVSHYVPFLKAEQMALAGRLNEASEHYQQAIALASEDGHLLHAALSSERYSEFLIAVMKQKKEGRYRLNESIRLYREWGAVGKVLNLLVKSDDLDDSSA
ncbi:MAG: hypothetical protein SGBAC_010266 [Bacillariaceae sp.]